MYFAYKHGSSYYIQNKYGGVTRFTVITKADTLKKAKNNLIFQIKRNMKKDIKFPLSIDENQIIQITTDAQYQELKGDNDD